MKSINILALMVPQNGLFDYKFQFCNAGTRRRLSRYICEIKIERRATGDEQQKMKKTRTTKEFPPFELKNVLYICHFLLPLPA